MISSENEVKHFADAAVDPCISFQLIPPSASQSNFRYHLRCVRDLLPATCAATLHLFLFMDVMTNSRHTHISLSFRCHLIDRPIQSGSRGYVHSQDATSHFIWAAVDAWRRNWTSVQPADVNDDVKNIFRLMHFLFKFFLQGLCRDLQQNKWKGGLQWLKLATRVTSRTWLGCWTGALLKTNKHIKYFKGPAAEVPYFHPGEAAFKYRKRKKERSQENLIVSLQSLNTWLEGCG